jgi:NAD(P)H dehydrogenase (quinone)
VIDLASRKVVGWAMSNRINAELVNGALTMAFWQHKPPPGLIMHTDRGSQYTSDSYVKLIKQYKNGSANESQSKLLRASLLALVITANPSPTSFSHAMANAATQVLRDLGYVIRPHDLYAEGFNPVQPVGETKNTMSDDQLVERHCSELKEADLILVFHPNWWSQPPAILKGWIDRVFRLNTAYAYPLGIGLDGVPVGLLKARAALIFNTSNTPQAREEETFGDPLERIWKNSIFALCGVDCVIRRMYGPIASSTVEQRSEWLAEVKMLTRANAA